MVYSYNVSPFIVKPYFMLSELQKPNYNTGQLTNNNKTVGPHYTAVRYNMKSDITRWLWIVESMTGHFYVKWHEICNWLIKYFEIIWMCFTVCNSHEIKTYPTATTYPHVYLLSTNLITHYLGLISQTNSPITTLDYCVTPPTKFMFYKIVK